MLNREIRDKYLATIGIECHVQLATKTKLFSAVDNDARDAEPNSRVSVIDYALPGMLPYLNKEAVRLAARAAYALDSEVARVSRFDRKHYFYPDLPKGYQISQMYQPTILAGHVDLPDGATVRINHAHLEEDAGKLVHRGDHSEVDLNRAGTPLIEIVSEPDIHSAAQAKAFAQELWLLMTYAGVTFGDLYHGNMRFDVNTSVALEGSAQLGTRSEVKNLNSFKSVERAVEYEIERQIKLLEKGEKVVQETRGWDEAKGKTTPQRSKENAQDYRYMPEPDIPPIVLDEAEIKQMQADMPMLPPEYRAKFAPLGVDGSVINALLADQAVAKLMVEIIDNSDITTTKRIANLFASALPNREENTQIDNENHYRFAAGEKAGGEEKDGAEEKNGAKKRENNKNNYDSHNQYHNQYNQLPSGRNLVKLSEMIGGGKLSSTAGKEVFAQMLNSDDDPETIAKAKNLIQVSDTAEIEKIVAQILSAPDSQKAVSDIKSGNDKAIGFLVGQVMKASQGKANPALAQKLIRTKITADD
jgi:aspartyl-tRNA(Asn)/glutamyl-tRNA(Gln) amidotransferase subunit B